MSLRRDLLTRFPWLRETDFLSDLRAYWGSGLATDCGVMAALSWAIRDKLARGSVEGLAELFAFLDPMLDPSKDAALDEAVSTCFFESIGEPDPAINRLYSPILGPRARRYLARDWPGTLAKD